MSRSVADEKTLERVRALLARAGHPNTPEEESRTSGVIAARMIFACGLVVTLPEEAPRPPPSREPPKGPPRTPKP